MTLTSSGKTWRETSTRGVSACCSSSDEIPDPLERVVEFLNAQMPNIEVLAVEIKQVPGRRFPDPCPARPWEDLSFTNHWYFRVAT